jgi:hypothetical protein
VYAQEASLILPNRQWNVLTCNYGHYSLSKIHTGHDTIINAIPCSQLYENGNLVGSYFTDEKKCFFVDTLGNASLIYDYGLQAGDTASWIPILDVFNEEELHLVVDSVSSTQVNGETKKVILFKPLSDGSFKFIQECWIEDVGSVHGFLYPIHFRLLEAEAQQKCDLTCFFQDDNLYWMNPNYTECGVSSVTEYKEEKLLLYPNPVSDVMHISSSSDELQYALYSILGKPLRQGILPPYQSVTINMSGLPCGIYMLHYTTNGVEKTRKIIKY